MGQFAEQRQQQRARPGADVENAQGLHAQAAAPDKIERGFDHSLGFRPRHQHGFADLQRQAPEFLDAENARDRLVLEPARGELLDRCGLLRGERPFAVGDQRGAIDAERVRNQQPRVGIG